MRGVVLAVPLAAGFGAALAVAGALPHPHGVAGTVAWYSATLAASLVTVFVVDRLARRLLPSASLLRLTLVFPDQAPSRMAVALSASSRTRIDAALRDATNAEDEAGVHTLVALATVLNSHDRRTRGHAERTRALAELVGEELGLSSRDRDRLRWAALLHDVGKIRVPSALLNKRGPLTDSEWTTMERHPVEGAVLVESLRPWLGDWVDGIGQHHERFDGSGYPDGLAHDEISFAARIITVADSFETMTAVRAYNKPKSVAAARREMVRCAGSHFDPTVVRALLNVSLGRLRWTVGIAAWVAELPILGVPTRVSADVVTGAAALQPAAVGAVLVAAASVAVPVAPAVNATAPLAPPAPPPAVGSPISPATADAGGGTSVATVVTVPPLAPAAPVTATAAPASANDPTPADGGDGATDPTRSTDVHPDHQGDPARVHDDGGGHDPSGHDDGGDHGSRRGDH
ncbi:MAG TPA: HD-GYP domain-containing protein [Acidimicrobiia bacterium]